MCENQRDDCDSDNNFLSVGLFVFNFYPFHEDVWQWFIYIKTTNNILIANLIHFQFYASLHSYVILFMVLRSNLAIL
jgi:hypothetical protein